MMTIIPYKLISAVRQYGTSTNTGAPPTVTLTVPTGHVFKGVIQAGIDASAVPASTMLLTIIILKESAANILVNKVSSLNSAAAAQPVSNAYSTPVELPPGSYSLTTNYISGGGGSYNLYASFVGCVYQVLT